MNILMNISITKIRLLPLKHNKFTWRKCLGICMILFVLLIGGCGGLVDFSTRKEIIAWEGEERYKFIISAILLALMIFWYVLVKFNISVFDKIVHSLSNYMVDNYREKFMRINKENHYVYINSKKNIEIIVSLLMGILHYIICSKNDIKFLFFYIMLCVCACFICVTMFARTENKYRWVRIAVMTCGITYYTYVLTYANITKINNLLNNVLNNAICLLWIALFACAVIFYIAGCAIYPMIGMVKFFFFTKWEEQLDDRKIDNKKFVYDIKNIRRFFIWMTAVNICAYLHLYAIVYYLGLSGNVVTEILFGMGSVFPLLMFSATIFLYSDLTNKINIKCNYKLPKGFQTTTFFGDITTVVTSLLPILVNIKKLLVN